MKKTTLLLLATMCATTAAMAQITATKKVSDLTRDTTPTGTWLVITSDPAGTAEPHAITATNLKAWATQGQGTVTSVALTLPGGLSIAGSPVTTSGTLAVSLTVTGLLKGSAGAFTAAQAGTDYLAPNGSGAALTGITATQVGADADGAATAAQAFSIQRANHTGSQTASTISDFNTAAATAAPVQSVAGRAGTVTLTKADVGLGNVLNTAQEPALGNPGTDGFVLSSTTGGTRSWVAASAFNPAAALSLTASTASTSPTTGALVVTGGVGVGGQITGGDAIKTTSDAGFQGPGGSIQFIGSQTRINFFTDYLIATFRRSGEGGGEADFWGPMYIGGRLRLDSPANLKAFTVATLPAGVTGDVAYVTDATAPTHLGALTGGGTVTAPVFYNGAAWVSF